MTIAADLMQRHFQALMADTVEWQSLIANDIVWDLAYAPAIGHPTRLFGRIMCCFCGLQGARSRSCVNILILCVQPMRWTRRFSTSYFDDKAPSLDEMEGEWYGPLKQPD